MISFVVIFGILGCALAAPQSGYNYSPNRNVGGYKPLAVQPLNRPAQQYTPAPAYSGVSRNNVPITSYNNEINYDGSFQYSFATGDGTQQQASGYIKNPGNKDLEAQIIQGSYSYISPEGQNIQVTYVADENGFRAEGAHLPTPPPIPEAIAKSLQLIAKTQPAAAQNINYNQQYSGNRQGGYKY